jgi:hypothetical protein
MLILLTDYLGHNAMRHYRDTAAAHGIPVLACRRSATAVAERLRMMAGSRPESFSCVPAVR